MLKPYSLLLARHRPFSLASLGPPQDDFFRSEDTSTSLLTTEVCRGREEGSQGLCAVWVQRAPDRRGHFRSNCCDSLAQTCCSNSTLSFEVNLPDISWDTSSSSQYWCSCERFPCSSLRPLWSQRQARSAAQTVCTSGHPACLSCSVYLTGPSVDVICVLPVVLLCVSLQHSGLRHHVNACLSFSLE